MRLTRRSAQTNVATQAQTMEAALLKKADYRAIRREQRQQVAEEIERNKSKKAAAASLPPSPYMSRATPGAMVRAPNVRSCRLDSV